MCLLVFRAVIYVRNDAGNSRNAQNANGQKEAPAWNSSQLTSSYEHRPELKTFCFTESKFCYTGMTKGAIRWQIVLWSPCIGLGKYSQSP